MTRPLSVGAGGSRHGRRRRAGPVARNADIVAARAGRPIAVTAVSARDRTRDRGVSLAGLRWFDDPVALAAEPGVDVVVEVIGGADGAARAVVRGGTGRAASLS